MTRSSTTPWRDRRPLLNHRRPPNYHDSSRRAPPQCPPHSRLSPRRSMPKCSSPSYATSIATTATSTICNLSSDVVSGSYDVRVGAPYDVTSAVNTSHLRLSRRSLRLSLRPEQRKVGCCQGRDPSLRVLRVARATSQQGARCVAIGAGCSMCVMGLRFCGVFAAYNLLNRCKNDQLWVTPRHLLHRPETHQIGQAHCALA